MKRKTKKNDNFAFNLALLLVGILTLIMFLAGCAEPKPIIQKVNVEVPCEVEKIPTEPREIDLEHSTITSIMKYVESVVQYAKEIRPIMRECVVQKKIKAKERK